MALARTAFHARVEPRSIALYLRAIDQHADELGLTRSRIDMGGR